MDCGDFTKYKYTIIVTGEKFDGKPTGEKHFKNISSTKSILSFYKFAKMCHFLPDRKVLLTIIYIPNSEIKSFKTCTGIVIRSVPLPPYP